jgi:hypothetical protein
MLESDMKTKQCEKLQNDGRYNEKTGFEAGTSFISLKSEGENMIIRNSYLQQTDSLKMRKCVTYFQDVKYM